MYLGYAGLVEFAALGGRPLYAEGLGIVVGLAAEGFLCQFLRQVAVEGLGTTVNCDSLAKGLMPGMMGMVMPWARALATKSKYLWLS